MDLGKGVLETGFSVLFADVLAYSRGGFVAEAGFREEACCGWTPDIDSDVLFA